VTVTVTYDATATTAPVHCSLELVAGEASWDPEMDWIPPRGEVAFCDSGSAGTVAAVFEVPEAFLSRVQGVGVSNPGGASPLLLGRPG
jgi:hypothetical protein